MDVETAMRLNEDLKIIFKEKALEILMTIYLGNIKGRDVYIQYIASKVNSPHSYVWLIVKKFEDAGIVECVVNGRTKIIKLTEKGEKVASYVKKIVEEMSK